MPTDVNLSLQVVNGDPATTGGNINITTSTIAAAIATETDEVVLSTVATGDTITVGGLVYTYEYLGSHLVRSDPLQPAAYIRIIGPLPAGATLSIGDTFAFDLTGEPGDPDYPDLQNGNTQGTVADLDTTTRVQFPGVCFAKGTRIKTPEGYVAVEALEVGHLVDTLDGGPKPLRAVVRSFLDFSVVDAKHKPIEFKPNSLGDGLPHTVLSVSPQHRIVIEFGGQQHLVPAKGLLHHAGVRRKDGCRSVEYYHLVFARHEMVFSEGVATESFFPGPQALSALDAEAFGEVMAIFPELAGDEAPAPEIGDRSFIGVSQAERLMVRGAEFSSIGYAAAE